MLADRPRLCCRDEGGDATAALPRTAALLPPSRGLVESEGRETAPSTARRSNSD